MINYIPVCFGFSEDGKGDKMIVSGPLGSGDYGLGIFQLKETMEIGHSYKGEVDGSWEDLVEDDKGVLLIFEKENGIKSLEIIIKLATDLFVKMNKKASKDGAE